MRIYLKLFVGFSIVVLTVLFNIGLIDIRFEEMNYLLGKIGVDRDATSVIGIVAKYELIRRRMESGKESRDDYELEAKIQAITSESGFSSSGNEIKKKYLIPVRIFLNIIRFTLGKEFINPTNENKIFNALGIAYFWERNRKYPEAIKIYNEVLKMEVIKEELESAVLLHKAFSFSMMSEYSKSKEIYGYVINTYPNTNAGVIAWKLLEFLESVEKKLESVKKKNLSDLQKAKKYFFLMDFRSSIKYFSLFLRKNEKGQHAAEARFLKGRSHEELGENKNAVFEYRQVIKTNRNSNWAKEANRRILMVGEFYDYQKKMADEARIQLKQYKDDGFVERIRGFKKMMSEDRIQKVLFQKMKSGELKTGDGDTDIFDLINSIGDLTGSDKNRENDLTDKIGSEKVAKAVETETNNFENEFIHKRAINTHPFRRPGFIRKVIDENENQLSYIYNKRLKKGIKLSGKMVVNMSIATDGKIISAKIINSDIGDHSFETEVLDKICKWKFRKVPEKLGTLNISYPFEFYEEQK